jgi:hypothetical protein
VAASFDSAIGFGNSAFAQHSGLSLVLPPHKRIIAKGSYHYVQIYRPELLVIAIQEVVDDARATATFEATQETEYK